MRRRGGFQYSQVRVHELAQAVDTSRQQTRQRLLGQQHNAGRKAISVRTGTPVTVEAPDPLQ